MPRNDKGEPLFEQAEDATQGWDALVEYAEGDTKAAQTVADIMLKNAEKELKNAKKLEAKGNTPAEILASHKANEEVLNRAQRNYDMWQQMSKMQSQSKPTAKKTPSAMPEATTTDQPTKPKEGDVTKKDAPPAEADNSKLASHEDDNQIKRDVELGDNELHSQRDEVSQEVYNGLEENESVALMSAMEANAIPSPKIELTPTTWVEQFGEHGRVTTPIGIVKMGSNQIAKLFEKGRSEQFSMIKPTLEQPLVIIEVPSEASNGQTERNTSLLFVKTFIGENGEKMYYFKSVTVQKDGMEVSVSSHYDRAKRIKEALKKGKLLYRFDGGAQTEQRPADVSVTASSDELQGKNNKEILSVSEEQNTSKTSERKDTAPMPKEQTPGQKSSESPTKSVESEDAPTSEAPSKTETAEDKKATSTPTQTEVDKPSDAPVSMAELEANSKPKKGRRKSATKKADVPTATDDSAKTDSAIQSEQATSIEPPRQKPAPIQSKWLGDEDMTEFDALFEELSDILGGDNIAQEPGLTKSISFHTSRHSFATLTLAAGGDLYTLSRLMGHFTIEST